jgi:hypothetical protein
MAARFSWTFFLYTESGDRYPAVTHEGEKKLRLCSLLIANPRSYPLDAILQTAYPFLNFKWDMPARIFC